MKKMRAFKFQLKPTMFQRMKMAQFAGCRRFAYNRALALQKEQIQNNGKVVGYAGLCKRLTEWRHCGKNSRIFLPKLGWIRYRKSRETSGILKQVTVSRCGEAWYVSIQTEEEITVSESHSGEVVGIDLGVATFATLSDGTKYVSEVDYGKFKARIAREQSKLALKVKLSANWQKQAKRIQRLYRRLFNCRRDFQHKTSTAISKNHAVVVIEDLNVKGMSASASGSVENPGTNVRAKAGLNRSITNQSWGEFRRQLEYKMQAAGGMLIAVSAKYTSLKCSKCGHTCKENRKTQSAFVCVVCRHAESADLNAARNIHAAGLAVLACGQAPSGVGNQEPTVSVSTFVYSANVLT